MAACSQDWYDARMVPTHSHDSFLEPSPDIVGSQSVLYRTYGTVGFIVELCIASINQTVVDYSKLYHITVPV